MFNKFEILGFGVAILLMAVALYFIRAENTMLASLSGQQQAQGLRAVMVGGDTNREEALRNASQGSRLNQLVVDDIVIGVGDEVKKGDTVVVNYVGTLEDGTEFDSSYKRGEAFTFKVGAGRVITGWDEGVVGMKMGGKRILVVPSDKGYGDKGYGPIPGKATLVFMIELLEIK